MTDLTKQEQIKVRLYVKLINAGRKTVDDVQEEKLKPYIQKETENIKKD